jgi:hypothetical protein
MEEGGHYYTVYITSLAVGFKEPLAFQHAVLAQMPDEVGWLDAANLHIKQVRSHTETNMTGQNSPVPNDWRYMVEYALHSLPGNHLSSATQSSAYQRTHTTKQLLSEDPTTLKFGLLLHRIGDTYAHSRMNGGESMMYTVTPNANGIGNWKFWNDYGHGHHVHDPDYPFLRPELFMSYLQNLYEILYAKAVAPSNKVHLRDGSAVPFSTVRTAFAQAFAAVKRRGDAHYLKQLETVAKYSAGRPVILLRRSVVSKETEAQWLIEEMRMAAKRITGMDLRSYSPEKEGARPLAQFLREHPELNHLNINGDAVVNAVRDMIPPPGQPDPPGYFEKLSNEFNWHLNNFSSRPWQYFPGGRRY